METNQRSAMRMTSGSMAALILLLSLTGCANGVLFNNGLYSHITTPVTFNQKPTDLQDVNKLGRGRIEHIQYQITVEVGTNGIGDVAKKHGMETVYYADMERQSFLFGLWQREFIHIYGK